MTKQTARKHIAQYEANYAFYIKEAQEGETQVEQMANFGNVTPEGVMNLKQYFVVANREAAQQAKDNANNLRNFYGL